MSKILVIEDDDVMRGMIVATLSQAGYLVSAAQDGREGLARFHDDPTDLIITDIVMPGKDGIEVVMTLRKEHPDVPVIVISGDSSRSTLYLGIASKLGAQAILEKPFAAGALLQAIEAVCPPAG